LSIVESSAAFLSVVVTERVALPTLERLAGQRSSPV
jgi:hypothetical protein